MKQQDKRLLGWLMLIIAVILFVRTVAGKTETTTAAVIGIILAVFGIILLIKTRTPKEYWRNVSSDKVNGVLRRIAREDSYNTIVIIKAGTKEPAVKQAAEERGYVLLQKMLDQVKTPEEARKTIALICKECNFTDQMGRILKTASEKFPEVTRQVVDAEISAIVASKRVADHMEFLSEVATLYPDAIRLNCEKIKNSLHLDTTSHADKPAGFHTDQTSYYDFVKYPDGRTVPNKNGRQKHTDTRSAYSDCHSDSHTDNSTHSDSIDEKILSRLKPYIL